MKHLLLVFTGLYVLATACTSAPTPTPVPPTATALPPTSTPLPTATATPVPPTLTPTRIPFEFEFLGVPASYSQKPRHWSLVDLQLWHNRIYTAHGDWDANTGPVRSIYFDISTEKFIQDDGFAFSEEAIEKFHIYNDMLYAPGVDATESWDFGNVYFKNWGGKWTKLRTVPRAIHVFDVAVQGKTLAASGASDYPVSAAYVWTSTDNGQTWKQSFPIHPGATNNIPLQVILFVLKDRLYAATPQDGCLVFDNDTWVKASCLPDSHTRVDKHVLHQNVVAMIPYWRNATRGTQLYFFNGKEQWSVGFGGVPVRDAVSTSDGLYVLVGTTLGNGSIFHASSLDCRCEQDFTRIMDFDMSKDATRHDRGNDVFSLEYANGRFYVGFADGRLFRSKPYQP